MRLGIIASFLAVPFALGACAEQPTWTAPEPVKSQPPATATPPTTPVPALTTPVEPTPKEPKKTTTPSSATQNAHDRLAALRRVDRNPKVPEYRRDEFGPRWKDVDGNGCNQRDDVLLRDAIPGTVKTQWQGRCPHDVLAGSWKDPYTGKTLVFTDLKNLSQARAIQIDHVVALSEAWKSGAHAWPYDKRVRFANTLDNLLAVDGPTNMSKGDGDPAAWRPRKGYQCSYARRWIRVKHKWKLGADESEVRALTEMLGYCK